MQSVKHLAWILVIKMSSCYNDLCNICVLRLDFKMIDLNGHQIQKKYHHITSFVIVVITFCTIKKIILNIFSHMFGIHIQGYFMNLFCLVRECTAKICSYYRLITNVSTWCFIGMILFAQILRSSYYQQSDMLKWAITLLYLDINSYFYRPNHFEIQAD